MADYFEIQNPAGDQPGQIPITPEVREAFRTAMEVVGTGQIGSQDGQLPEVSEALEEPGASIHARLDYPPLDVDTPGALITGTLTSDGTTPIPTPIFITEVGQDLYFEPSIGEIYNYGSPGVDEWEIYFYAGGGVSWVSLQGDDLESATWTPSGSNTGTPSVQLITRPKTRAHICVANGATYENRGTLDAPDWHLVPTIESVTSQITVLAEKRLNSVAYVSPTYGNNSTARLGAINRPYQSVTAAIAAASRICLLDSATWVGGNLSKSIEIDLWNGSTLTVTTSISLNTHRLKIAGSGNLTFAPATAQEAIKRYGSPFGGVFHLDIDGDLIANPNVLEIVNSEVQNRAFIYCRRVIIQRTTSGTAAFASFNVVEPTVFFKAGTLFHSAGSSIFSTGGPTGSPKIVIGSGSIIYMTPGNPIMQTGANGGIFAHDVYYNDTASFQEAALVPIIGSVTPVPWVNEALLLTS